MTRYAQYAGHRFGERAVARLREQFVRQTLRLPVSVVEHAGTGDLATRSSVDVGTVGTTVRDVLPIIVLASAELALLFGAIFLLHPMLGLAALVGLPSIVAVARWYLRRASAAYLAEGAATAELTDALTTTAEGARTVEALGLRGERIGYGTERIGQVWATRRATLALRSVFFPVIEASYALPIAAVLLLGGFFLADGWFSLGEVVAAALYLQRAIEPLDRLLQWIEQGSAASPLSPACWASVWCRRSRVARRPNHAASGSSCTVRGSPTRRALTCCTASTWRCIPASG
ncbi:hypothetical protein Prum_021620 [Phytohabitans rumicis]|uniref:ABC transmembrane type-1 domain-containing protein n=1 Tax=Phytohabitans rumicis TaxID=1076125 RepID=A0A6V8KYS1_9ACTN|nr:hypothetical protein Prum_021620 [Phytohabitans rumicis]